jgi:hypothetical protein
MLSWIYDISPILDYFLKADLHKWESGTESMNMFMTLTIMPNCFLFQSVGAFKNAIRNVWECPFLYSLASMRYYH